MGMMWFTCFALLGRLSDMLQYDWYVIVGAQFGTVISMPLSGLLSASSGGWPSIFYVFGAIGAVWCVAFLILVKEDPGANKSMNDEERTYIQEALGANTGIPVSSADVANAVISFFICLPSYVADSAYSMEIHIEVLTILGYTSGTYGTQLRL